MPGIISRYLVRHILGMTALVAAAMLAIYSFINWVTDAGDLPALGFGGVLMVTLYQLPAGLALLLPIVAMIGCLMALGNLASLGEIAAMRAAGVSPTRIAGAAMLAGLLLGPLGWWLGDYGAPAGNRAADALKAQHGNNALGKSLWLRDGALMLRIGKLQAADYAEDIQWYRLDDHSGIASVGKAKSARYADGAWQVTDRVDTRFDGNRAVPERFARSRFDSAVTPNTLKLFLLEADAINAQGLRRLIAYLDSNRLDAQRYRLELASKLVAPFTVVAMALFAVPFAFGPLRSGGAGQRLLLGILLGLGFYVINRVCLSLGQIYGWPPFWVAAGPTALWAAIGALRLRGVK